MKDIRHNLKVLEEENESLKVKLWQASNEVHLAHNRIQDAHKFDLTMIFFGP